MGVQGKVVSIASHCDVWSIQADVVDLSTFFFKKKVQSGVRWR